MAYRKMWETEVRHKGLNKYRNIRGTDRYIVEQKAKMQQLTWDEMWEKKQASEAKKREREAAIRSKEEKKALAIEKTEEAQGAISELEKLLSHTLSIDDKIDWSTLLDTKPFPKRKPDKPTLGFLGFLIRFFSGNDKAASEYETNLKQWDNDKVKYENKQKANNELIHKKKEQYMNKGSGAVSDYCEMVLGNSIYPEYFPQEWDIDYQRESKILIVDYSLPDIDSIPTVKTVKYIISRDEFTETHLSTAALNKLYDSMLYQISLRTIHELYEADVVEAIGSIVFNGLVDAIDKATGQNVNSYIMSLQASKDEFLAINLDKVDPKACFRKLKGVGGAKLHGLSPVAPIISIDKEDRRFTTAYAVADEIDSGDNLAAMDWQDFENLIREIFEKEFVSSGGEVKITQASRDGGVDAFAFDPDPIRGGKIVIQAKRYSNVVGVSAVRDLFGATVNEGATKGILITTAYYGPDAYEFAKGKPLTLLNGGNLLHLLEKHGHKARIDLKEAKQILNEQKI